MRRLRFPLALLAIALTVVDGLRGMAIAVVVLVANELLALMLALYDRNEARPPGFVRRLLSALGAVLRFRRPVAALSGFPSYERALSNLAWARQSARDFDHGLRPQLLAIAEVALADHHGVDLRSQPERARRLLGERAWTILRPGEPASDDRSAAGHSIEEVAAVVSTLEHLAGRAAERVRERGD